MALSLAGSLELQTPKIKSGLFLKNRLFFGFWYFGGLLCGMVSGPPVAPGNYTLYKPQSLQACLRQKSGLFLKNRLFFCFWYSWGFCVAW